VLKPKKTKNGKPIRDEFGQDVLDDSKRVIYCTKNRQDERLFSLIIEKNEIFGTFLSYLHGSSLSALFFSYFSHFLSYLHGSSPETKSPIPSMKRALDGILLKKPKFSNTRSKPRETVLS
jgi:hypothetical protein